MHDEQTLRRQEIGDELRALRMAAKYSAREAARVINVDQSLLSRIERGHRSPSIPITASLLTLYRATPATRKHLLDLAQEADEYGLLQRDCASFEGRQRTLTWLEGKAELIVNFQTAVVPGLLQIGEYTQAILANSGAFSEDEIEDRMITRLRRQSVLMRRRPPELLALIDEQVLYRPIGGCAVQRHQLDHLVKAGQRSNITIRIVPGGCMGPSGDFELLHLPQRQPVVVLENLTSSLFLEEGSDVDAYRRAFNYLASCALDEPQSGELIAKTAKRLGTEVSNA